MLDTVDPREKFFSEREESVADVKDILSIVEYDFNELASVKDPSVLVMGTGPYFPEAHIIKQWAEENKKGVTVHCLEREEIDQLFIKKILALEESEYFKMEMICSSFESYEFPKNFDLILLLRYPNLSNIHNDVYGKITRSLNKNGSFIMSGGYNDRFTGFALSEGNLNIESRGRVPWSPTDFYRVYSGENNVFKFRKREDGI